VPGNHAAPSTKRERRFVVVHPAPTHYR